MLRNLCCYVVLILCVLSPPPGTEAASLDQAMETYITTIGELADILTQVKDEASAQAVKPALQGTLARLQGVTEQFKDIPLSKTAELERKYNLRMREAAERLRQEILRVMSDLRVGRHVYDALVTMPTLPPGKP